MKRIFRFKQFALADNWCNLKIGMDGILLGSWMYQQLANTPASLQILDVGTGSGLIACQLAQLRRHIITGIEINYSAFLQAKINGRTLHFQPAPQFFLGSFEDFFSSTPIRYDCIVCNPPFFRSGLPAQSNGRQIARHDKLFNWAIFLKSCHSHLQDEGQLYLIYPAMDEQFLQAQLAQNSLFTNQKIVVFTQANNLAKRLLLRIGKKPPMQVEEQALHMLDDNGHFSLAYKTLTQDFYLNF